LSFIFKNLKLMKNEHSFHIPVMGIGFTVDTALKVAHLGINSVLSLIGDKLHEKLRKYYCEKYGLAYEEITDKIDDYKAKRTTAYLNLLDDLTAKKFESYKNSTAEYKTEIEACIDLLPNSAQLKKEFRRLMEDSSSSDQCKKWVEENLQLGSIDVNIMTKLDRENFVKGEKLPPEHNDGHVAMRAYANSTLDSSLVLSAGLNPRLFTYMEQFEDFYPDSNGYIKKKIILKVSDYRSALVQGKFLAKKGLWISEYRVESGLNCGGHAFATDGFLMGPILSEFKNNKKELFDSVFEVLKTALDAKNKAVFEELLPFKFTAQGGVGTSEEHQFLLDEYQLDSVGWGSPFLLVPEAVNVDDETITRLIEAKEEDFYLSRISPLGVPFNSLRDTSKERERKEKIAKGKPGSPCIEGSLALFNKEFTDDPICTASRQYQKLKIEELKKDNLSVEEYQEKYEKIVEKTCLCTGLVNPVLIVNELKTPTGNGGVSICPGPNMFYFKKVMTMSEITSHIYGKKSIPFSVERPHMFVKELYAYIKYLKGSIEDTRKSVNKKGKNRLLKFSENLSSGIEYYQSLFNANLKTFYDTKAVILADLQASIEKLNTMHQEIEALSIELPIQKI